MKKLDVGDIIYGENRIYGIREVLTVERVTPTQAICKKSKFKREINNNGEVRIIGEDLGAFNKTRYYLETEEIKKKFLRQNLIIRLVNFNYSSLTTETLQKIDSILILNLKNKTNG